jgi:hypothetical protein
MIAPLLDFCDFFLDQFTINYLPAALSDLYYDSIETTVNEVLNYCLAFFMFI